MIDNIRDQLIRDEGRVLSAYQDHLGFWTIGVGRLIDKRRGGGISQDEADYLLDNDIRKCRSQILARWPWVESLDAVRQAVLVNMCFQLGINGLAGFTNTLKLMRKGDYAGASAGMLASQWARQTPARAQRLAAQMKEGVWK